jgi:UDP-glucuronate decarboxylase
MLNILILGGAGFLGSNLTSSLLSLGHKVTCLDNLNTGRASNLESFKKSNKFYFVEADIRDPLMIRNDFDVILNMACPASPPKYQFDELYTLDTSYLGTRNALEFASQNDSTFLMASTSEIYGDPEISPQNEDYRGNVSTTGIRACYDEGKRTAETLCSIFKRKHNVDARIIRIFNTYGPYMDPWDGRVITNFLRQVIQGEPITIYGDGLQTRSFCYVNDLVMGIIAVALSKDYYGPVNLGNDNEFTILDLVEIIQTNFNANLATVFHALPADDPLQRKPDITKARKYYNWAPKTDLISGLNSTFDYLLKELR